MKMHAAPLVLLLLISFSSFAENPVDKLVDFYALKLHEETDFLRGIEIADRHLKELESIPEKTAEVYFVLSLLLRDRLTLEAKQAIQKEKRISKEDWFASDYFRQQYEKISSYMEQSIKDSEGKGNVLTYKELSAVISSPFVMPEVKEKAYKHSIDVLQAGDLGDGEHPLTKDQYIGRVYTMMMEDYCAQKKCREVKRLAEELTTYSNENKSLAEKLLKKYADKFSSTP